VRLPFREIRIALSRFLEEAVFAGGDWRGLLLILEGRDGQGWSRFGVGFSCPLFFPLPKVACGSTFRGVGFCC
jgi:hypothetical protein